MSLKNTLLFIAYHPINKENKTKALFRFLKWQINSRLNPRPMIFPFAEKSKLIVWKGLKAATGNLYCGLHEFEDMAFVLHFLRNTDIFVDVGANVGAYTLLGAKEVGAKTTAVEPIPTTFDILSQNIGLNIVQNSVTALNIGLGAEKGGLEFTKSLDSNNHVATKYDRDTVKVQVEKFDDIIKIDTTTLVKIDVEGYETEVLNGMVSALTNSNLQAIIIELNGSGRKFGYVEDEIHKKLLSQGFSPFAYAPFERRLTPIETYGQFNTLYIRDLEYAKKRVSSARKFRILNQEI